MKYCIFLIGMFVLGSCSQSGQGGYEVSPNLAKSVVNTIVKGEAKLSDYWYQGEAELTSYEYWQNRYQDVHPGQAVLVFVTEDFLTDKQVKNERYLNPNSVSVLKTNLIRTFPTGIYDYSVMTSVFTPVNSEDYPLTLKVATSSQEWCGQTYMQLNKVDEGYKMTLHSYFEQEADATKKVSDAILEDELFNRIRINPDALPTGAVDIIPSTMYLRLKHVELQPFQAKATTKQYVGDEFEGENLKVYMLTYPELDRTVEIVFESATPFKIVGWKDSYPSAFDGKIRTTMAKRKKSIMSPYWKKNSLEDMKLRDELGI